MASGTPTDCTCGRNDAPEANPHTGKREGDPVVRKREVAPTPKKETP